MKIQSTETIYKNPAYAAVTKLHLDNVEPFSNIEFKEGRSFIPLAQEEKVITLGGATYRASTNPKYFPHFSIFQYCKKKETRGLSTGHLTWYGHCENNVENDYVELHIHFRCAKGEYFYSQAKIYSCTGELKNKINISPKESLFIKEYAEKICKKILDSLSQCISEEHLHNKNLIENLLTELDRLSQNLNKNINIYNEKAKECIALMRETGDEDKTLFLLEKIVEQANTNQSQISQESQPSNVHNFLPPPNKKNEKRRVEKPAAIQSTSKVIDPQLKKELISVNNKLSSNAKSRSINEVERILNRRCLLEEKADILLKRSTDNELIIKALIECNSLQKDIKILFIEESKKGNIGALEKLKPFLYYLDANIFQNIVFFCNAKVYEFIVENFRESLLYLKSMAIILPCAAGSTNKKDPIMNISSILHYFVEVDKSTERLEVSLRNGANANSFFRITEGFTWSLLEISIAKSKANFFFLLLKYGADVNFIPDEPIRFDLLESQNNPTTLNKLIKLSTPKKGTNSVYTFPIKKRNIFYFAIHCNCIEIFSFLLEMRDLKINLNDALGYLIGVTDSPNLEMLKLIIKHGADINAIQEKRYTPLFMACGRDDLKLLQAFLCLGANPNMRISIETEYNNGIKLMHSYSALDWAFQKNQKIAYYLLEQTEIPLNFMTLGMALAIRMLDQGTFFEFDSSALRVKLSSVSTDLRKIILNLYGKNVDFRGGFTLTNHLNLPISQITESIDSVIKQGLIALNEKNWVQALRYFFMSLFFGNDAQRHLAMYNLAECYKLSFENDKARMYYYACFKYNPDSDIAQRALIKLNELEELAETTPSFQL